MTEYKYSVHDLDKLRQACGNKYIWGRYNIMPTTGPSWGWSYTEIDKYKCVEEMVRTHMIAGHTAEDLYASERDSNDPT